MHDGDRNRLHGNWQFFNKKRGKPTRYVGQREKCKGLKYLLGCAFDVAEYTAIENCADYAQKCILPDFFGFAVALILIHFYYLIYKIRCRIAFYFLEQNNFSIIFFNNILFNYLA